MINDELKLIELLEQGTQMGRISPYLASYIAAAELKVWPDELEFDPIPGVADEHPALAV